MRPTVFTVAVPTMFDVEEIDFPSWLSGLKLSLILKVQSYLFPVNFVIKVKLDIFNIYKTIFELFWKEEPTRYLRRYQCIRRRGKQLHCPACIVWHRTNVDYHSLNNLEYFQLLFPR